MWVMAVRREATTGGAWPEPSVAVSSAAKPAGDSFLHAGQGQRRVAAPAGPATPRVEDGVRRVPPPPPHLPFVRAGLHDGLGVGGGSAILVNRGPLAARRLPRELADPPPAAVVAATAVLPPRRMRIRGMNRCCTASATAVCEGGSGDASSSSESSKTMTSAGLQGRLRKQVVSDKDRVEVAAVAVRGAGVVGFTAVNALSGVATAPRVGGVATGESDRRGVLAGRADGDRLARAPPSSGDRGRRSPTDGRPAVDGVVSVASATLASTAAVLPTAAANDRGDTSPNAVSWTIVLGASYADGGGLAGPPAPSRDRGRGSPTDKRPSAAGVRSVAAVKSASSAAVLPTAGASDRGGTSPRLNEAYSWTVVPGAPSAVGAAQQRRREPTGDGGNCRSGTIRGDPGPAPAGVVVAPAQAVGEGLTGGADAASETPGPTTAPAAASVAWRGVASARAVGGARPTSALATAGGAGKGGSFAVRLEGPSPKPRLSIPLPALGATTPSAQRGQLGRDESGKGELGRDESGKGELGTPSPQPLPPPSPVPLPVPPPPANIPSAGGTVKE